MEKAAAKADAAAQSKPAEPARPVIDEADWNAALPSPANDVVLADPGSRQMYLTAMQRFYEYRARGYTHRERVFRWQLYSSWAIFIVVLLLVGTGIYFAAKQFAAAKRTAMGSTGLETRLELSAKGVTVNSSVLGVIVLLLSLAFFYLYLVHVYPIQDAF